MTIDLNKKEHNLKKLITDEEQLEKLKNHVDTFISRFHECKEAAISSDDDLEDRLEPVFDELINFRQALKGKLVSFRNTLRFVNVVEEACFLFYEADIRLKDEITKMDSYKNYQIITKSTDRIIKIVGESYESNEEQTKTA